MKKLSGKATIPYAKRPSDICYRSNRRPVTELEKAKTLRMAQEKASKFPNSFLVIMRPSGVYKRFFMVRLCSLIVLLHTKSTYSLENKGLFVMLTFSQFPMSGNQSLCFEKANK